MTLCPIGDETELVRRILVEMRMNNFDLCEGVCVYNVFNLGFLCVDCF